MIPNKIAEKLNELQYLLFSIARFNIVIIFGTNSFLEKLRYADHAYYAIYKAKLVSDYAKYMYNQGEKRFAWDTKNIRINELINLDGANIPLAKELIDVYNNKILYIIGVLRTDDMDNKLMYSPVLFLLDQLALDKEGGVGIDSDIHITAQASAPVTKTAMGPRTELIDEMFEPTYSLLDRKSVSFDDNIENNIEYFWNLATREILAADLCGLSVIEYDYLPFEFYYDFITQFWDETRHACHYIDLTKKLLPEVYRQTNDLRLKSIIERYLDSGKLPIPKEKNFYEAMQNATIQERMILLNIRTEAPAVSRLTKKMESIFFKGYPTIRDAFQYDKNDEIRHGRIGAKWLKYMYPDISERKAAMESADSLRGFLMATALSMYSDKDYLTFLSEFKMNFEWA